MKSMRFESPEDRMVHSIGNLILFQPFCWLDVTL